MTATVGVGRNVNLPHDVDKVVACSFIRDHQTSGRMQFHVMTQLAFVAVRSAVAAAHIVVSCSARRVNGGSSFNGDVRGVYCVTVTVRCLGCGASVPLQNDGQSGVVLGSLAFRTVEQARVVIHNAVRSTHRFPLLVADEVT